MIMDFSEVVAGYRPKVAIEISWSQGAGATAIGFRDVWILAERLSTGTSTADEVRTVPFANADDAAAWYGNDATGHPSNGAYMARQVFRGAKLKNKVYGAAVAESAGAHAAQVVTFAGGNCGTAGKRTFNIAGAVFTVDLEAGFTATNSGDALVTAFDALPADQMPACKPVNNAGVVTFTATNHGVALNGAPCYNIVTGEEPTTQTCTWTGAVFASGATLPTLTTVLANMAGVSTPIIVTPWSDIPQGTTGTADIIMAHVNTKCDAEHMGHCAFVVAWDDAIADLVTSRAALDTDNSERVRILGVTLSGSWAAGLAAWGAAALASENDLVRPMDNLALPFAVAPPSSGDYPLNSEIETLLENGITPIIFKDGSVRIGRGVVSRTFSGVPMDWGIVDGIDYFRYRCNSVLAAKFQNFKIGQDGETNLDEHTTTPAGILDVIYGVATGDDMRGILRNVDDLWPDAKAEINATYSGRVDFEVSAAIFDGLHILAGKIRQRSGIIPTAAV
jgi:phage tail sheath gpL-like